MKKTLKIFDLDFVLEVVENCSRWLLYPRFNPLWLRPQFELLDDLIRDKFEVIVSGVFAYPLDKTWLKRKINSVFVRDMKKLFLDFGINPAGEGGEYESLVVNCPLFKERLNIKDVVCVGDKNSWRLIKQSS